MSHTTCTQGNQVDSQLLMVGNQIVNLTSNPSFGHNLCFRCPNGPCEPILNIYVSIDFQWYKELLNPFGFDPWNCSLNIWESTETPTPKVEAPLGVWGFIPSHFLSLLGFLSWLATLQALALVVSPRLRLQHPLFDGCPTKIMFSFLRISICMLTKYVPLRVCHLDLMLVMVWASAIANGALVTITIEWNIAT